MIGHGLPPLETPWLPRINRAVRGVRFPLVGCDAVGRTALRHAQWTTLRDKLGLDEADQRGGYRRRVPGRWLARFRSGQGRPEK